MTARPAQFEPVTGDRDIVVMLTHAGRASLDGEHLTAVEQRAEVRVHPLERAPGPREAAAILTDATVLATTNRCLPPLTPELLDRCPRLRHVVLYATGYEHIDLDLLTSRGVTLTTLPEYATAAVAEHALALMLTLAARTALANDRSRGLVPADTSLRGVELGGRVLGVVGTGRIGTHLGRIAAGIGMTVVGTDIDPRARMAASRIGIRSVDHDTVFRQADVVAVCASTIPGRPPIVGAPELSMLWADGFVVNVGRPCLVDTAAVVEALSLRRLRGYAVDEVVLAPGEHGNLVAEGRLLQTGHSAWWRDEVLRRGARMFGDAILGAVGGVALGHDAGWVARPGDGVDLRPAGRSRLEAVAS